MTRIIDLTAQGKRVDPPGCGCTDCIVGDSIPYNEIPVPEPGDVILVGYVPLIDVNRVLHDIRNITYMTRVPDAASNTPIYMRYEDLTPTIINKLRRTYDTE